MERNIDSNKYVKQVNELCEQASDTSFVNNIITHLVSSLIHLGTAHYRTSKFKPSLPS